MLLQLQDEYRDYLLRYAEHAAAWEAPPLTFQAFCAAVERWKQEYHQAWADNRIDHMACLEGSLLLLAHRSPFGPESRRLQ